MPEQPFMSLGKRQQPLVSRRGITFDRPNILWRRVRGRVRGVDDRGRADT